MKTKFLIIAAAIFMAAGFANAQDIVFAETFTNRTGSNQALSMIDWKVNVGFNATAMDDNADLRDSPILSSANFLFFRPVAAGLPWLAWTDKVSGLGVGIDAVERIGFRLGNDDPDEEIRLALRIDNQWYASAGIFQVEEAQEWIGRDINPGASEWLRLNLIPGSELSLDEPATLPARGEIQGVGFFAEATAERRAVRLDDLQIRLIPEAGVGGEEASVDAFDPALLFCPEANMMGFTHPPLIEQPGPEYLSPARNYQGIPGIERSPGGRLWVTWYAGKIWEERFNYAVLATSGDDGHTWSEDVEYVIDPDGPGPLRAADANLWLDPEGKLWWFWWVNEKVWGGSDPSKISVTMAVITTNPDDARPQWSEPFFLFRGLMLNKPIVTSRGEWLMPTNEWQTDDGIRIMVSTDKGATWSLRGTANVPAADRNADEPMLVERSDGSLWMLVRTRFGIGESVSTDQGRTWTEVAPYQEHTVSRFYLGKLQSGNLLLIRHGAIGEKGEREDLTAYLSDDDGTTWKGGLLLDERRRVSYPDAIQAPDGTIYAVYDFNRHLEKQILMAVFTEEDVLAGSFVSAAARQKVVVNEASGRNPLVGRINDGPPLSEDASGAVLVTDRPRAELVPVKGEVRPLHRSEDVFTDAAYLFRGFPGHRFFRSGMRYVFSPIAGTKARCVSPGMVYVFTPAAERSKKSVEAELLAQGFEKTSLPEFDLIFRVDEQARNSNASSVYQKEVQAGETIQFSEWGVLVF
jgi:hypothetical protein